VSSFGVSYDGRFEDRRTHCENFLPKSFLYERVGELLRILLPSGTQSVREFPSRISVRTI